MKPKIFYGWILVGVFMLIVSVGIGTSLYLYSVIAGAVGEEFSAGRSALMAGSTGMLLVMATISPLVGTLLDRFPNKWILITGALAMGLGFICIALATNIWMVVASYVLFISVGVATLSPLAASTVLSRWFARRLGLAVGIAALGTQLGGFVYPPLVAAVMEASDWRIAVGGLGVLIMIILPAVIWLLEADRPEDLGLHPDGDPAPPTRQAADTGADAPAPARLSFAQLFSQRNFILLVLIAGAANASYTALLANLSLFATDLGEPAVRGAFLISVVSMLGLACSPLFGWLCDSFNIKVMAAVMMSLLAATCLAFSVATSYSMLLIAAAFMGVGGGGVFPLWASLVGRLYHTRVYGQVMGSTTLVVGFMSAAAPLFAGWIYDVTLSYRIVFLTLLVILAALALSSSLLRVPLRPEEKPGGPGAANMAVS